MYAREKRCTIAEGYVVYYVRNPVHLLDVKATMLDQSGTERTFSTAHTDVCNDVVLTDPKGLRVRMI